MNRLGVLITMALVTPVLRMGWVTRIWSTKGAKQALDALSRRARSREHNGL